MKAVRTLAAALGLAVLVPAAAQAQISPFSVEARVGAAIPTGDFADGVTTGFGFDANVAYRVMPMLELYGGYSWTRFGFDDDEEFDEDVNMDDSGFAVGARVMFAGVPGIDPWVRGGVILHQLKTSFSEGPVSGSFTTDRAAGFEAAAGVAIPVAPRVALTPAVTFRTYTPKFDGESFDSSVQYVGLHLGGRISF